MCLRKFDIVNVRKIIVVGYSHHNTLGVIRCFGMRGYSVDFICVSHKDCFVSHSKYISVSYEVESESIVVDLLYKCYANEVFKPVIIACGDKIESVLDLNYDKLNKYFVFFNAGKQGIVTTYMDKKLQVDLAKANGFNVPDTFIYEGSIEKISYPCILKPLQSIKGGKHIFICYDKNDVMKALTSFEGKDILLVQQLLKSNSEFVILGLANDAKVLIAGLVLKQRSYKGGTLYSTVMSIDNLDRELIKKCEQMILDIGYEGIFGFEFIRTNDKDYFIELNLRVDATTYSLAVAGINLPVLYFESQEGELASSLEVKTIHSIVDYNDFKHRRDYNITMFKWIKQYLFSKCKYYLSFRDPAPFLYALMDKYR